MRCFFLCPSVLVVLFSELTFFVPWTCYRNFSLSHYWVNIYAGRLCLLNSVREGNEEEEEEEQEEEEEEEEVCARRQDGAT